MMEDSEEAMVDAEHCKVVGECTSKEDSSVVRTDTDKPADNGAKTDTAAEAETAETSTSDGQPVPTKDPTEDQTVPSADPEKPTDAGFTADTETDQPCLGGGSTKPDTSSDKTLDTVFSEDKDGDVKMTEGNSDNAVDSDSVVEIIPPERVWYEEKLNAKMNTFKERLLKLARVLKLSYPAYKPWLDLNETSVYHLDPPRRCPLDKPHTNRWKFICSRKTVQESTNKEEDSAEGTVNKKLKTVWQLGPTDGSGVNTDNASQYPPFVMRVVKVFEDLIRSIDEEPPTTADRVATEEEDDKKPPSVDEISQPEPAVLTEASIKKEPESPMKAVEPVNEVKEEPIKTETEPELERGHNWLWLLVRSNSKDELMVFATGKQISESTMQKLKQVFESGPGKDCNVKSLYCKSIDTKSGGGTTSNITFLAGTEALDETVSGVKIQLAPKTNFWCNASGVEQLGAAVADMLNPLQKITVMEVGCGLGLIGLMVASKCKKVIGLDAPSEVEEAEMTSELNKVENASFIMGQPEELIAKMPTLLKNTKAAAIVNCNTKLGRDIEMMTALRKIPSLRRVVMITTLTKQSVRAIMELTRPVEGDLGKPFMPLRAALVDTLPTGPHFEVVIRMERLNLLNIEEPWFWNHVKFRAGLAINEAPRKNPPNRNRANAQGGQAKTDGHGENQLNAVNANRRVLNRINKKKIRKLRGGPIWGTVPGTITGVVRHPPIHMTKGTVGVNLVKNPLASVGKILPIGKDSTLDTSNVVKKLNFTKTIESSETNPPVQSSESPASPDSMNPVAIPKSSEEASVSNLKKNPLARVQTGRGPRLSGAQKRKRHWAMTETQKQVGGGIVGILGSGIGAPKGANDNQGPAEKRMRGNGNRRDLRGRLSGPRLIQQTQNQQMLFNMAQQRLGGGQPPIMNVDAAKQLQNMLNMVIDQTNKLQSQLPRSIWDRIAPAQDNFQQQGQNNSANNSTMLRDRYAQNMGCQDNTSTGPNSEYGGNAQPPPLPLFNRAPVDRTKIMPAGMNPVESRDGQQSRGISQCLRRPDYRKYQGNNWNSSINNMDKNHERNTNDNSPVPLMESISRPLSPKRPFLSSSGSGFTQTRQYGESSYSQQDSNKRRQPTPPARRQPTPTTVQPPPARNHNPYSEIFQRRPVATQQNRQQQNSDMSRRGNSPPRGDIASSGRSASPPKRFAGNNWDLNKGNGSSQPQGNWSQRQQMQTQQQHNSSTGSDAPARRWSAVKTQNFQNWNNTSTNNDPQTRQQSINQNKRGGDAKEGMWMSGGGDIWNSQQLSAKPAMENQWGNGNNGQGQSGNRWNTRGNDNYRQSNNCWDNWRNSGNKDEDDPMDLPNNSQAPWNNGTGGKSRWQQSKQPSNSNWNRDEKKDQNWSNKSSDNNWQNNMPMSMNMSKPYWPNMGNQNRNDQSWMTPNDSTNSGSSGNWQNSNNFGSNNWRPQNYSGLSQQQRQNTFGSSNFKSGR